MACSQMIRKLMPDRCSEDSASSSSSSSSSGSPSSSAPAPKPKNAVFMLHQSAAGLAEILVFKEATTVETLRHYLENPQYGEPIELRKRDRVRLFLLEKTQRTFAKFGLQSYLEHKTVEEILKKLMKLILKLIEDEAKYLVIHIGKIIGRIICYLNPLPEHKTFEMVAGGEKILSVEKEVFLNYGETVRTVPSITFFPKTVAEIQSIVRYARERKKRVRASGMRHSWTPIFPDDEQILISMLPREVTDTLTHVRVEKDMSDIIKEWNSSLSSIEFLHEIGENHAAVKIGAATTNLEMLEWSLESRWTLPVDIIAVMITYGGSNATICHGAGIRSRSLSDLVLEITFVNVKSELQTVSDPELLKSVGGCFGMLGIVVSLTLKLDKMTYARWQPKKANMSKALPRPCSRLKQQNGTKTEEGGNKAESEEKAENVKRLNQLIEDSFYTEFFWFPNNGIDEGYWENCFKDDGKEEDSGTLNEKLESKYQVASTFLFDLITDVLVPLIHVDFTLDPDKTTFHHLIRKIFTKLVSKAGIQALPEPEEPITTSLVEALHFRQGFHYISVREMEIEIPIPSLEDGGPDYSLVQRAWWDAIDIIQASAEKGNYACDMTLEMRVMGSSDSTLAPYRGNKHGTISIEPVSTSVVPEHIWEDFKVKLINQWASYTDHDGTPLRLRPHWAKENPKVITWGGKTYTGKEYIKMIYQEEFKEFKAHLNVVCEEGGYNLQELKQTFGNHYMDNIFESVWGDYNE